jgi:hypothetical protein
MGKLIGFATAFFPFFKIIFGEGRCFRADARSDQSDPTNLSDWPAGL